MSSIRSTLIRSCFSKIQQELTQLEDWLNRDLSELPKAESAFQSGTDSTIIYQAIQQLSKQLDSQQHTLHHIIDRIDVLEETRNIHIQEKEENNLWLDSEGVQLQNEMVENEYEAIINVNKTEEAIATTPKSVITEPIVVEPVIAEPVIAEPVIAEPVVVKPVVVEPVIAEPVITEPVVVEPVIAEPVVVEPVVVEPVIAKPLTVELVITKPVVVEPVAEPVKEELSEEEEEEEEEDGLEEVEYNGTTYYRDSNLVMYLLDEEGQLTDPVGLWKEKSQTIKFYKK